MAKNAYPTGTDLSSFLTAAGISPDTLDVATAADAGIAEFERRVGRKMLAGEDATRYYDPPANRGGILLLDADLASLTSLTYLGTTYTEGTEFWLMPDNAATDGEPYQWVQFRYTLWQSPVPSAGRRSIAITGKWGYGTTLPEDAWLAMLGAGAVWLHPQITAALTGGVTSWHGADVSETYGEKPLSATLSSWQASVDAAVARYRRLRL